MLNIITLDHLVQKFNNGIKQVAKVVIPRTKRKNDWVPYWKDHNNDAIINERDTICKKNSDENIKKLILISYKIEAKIAACKYKKWVDFCSKFDPRKDPQDWKVINVLNNHGTQKPMEFNSKVITFDGHSSKTKKYVANLLALCYVKARKLSFNKECKKQKRTYKQVIKLSKLHDRKNILSNELTLDKLNDTINSLDPRK